MIVYVENFKALTKNKLIEVVSEFSKVAKYNITIKKTFYMLAMSYQKLYYTGTDGNQKALMRKIKDQNKWREIL